MLILAPNRSKSFLIEVFEMKYIRLSSIYYKDRDLYKKEYENRYKSPSCYHLPLDMKGNQAFVLVTTEMLNTIEAIYKYDNKIRDLAHALPRAVAYELYAKETMFDEITITNSIEGVYSSKSELHLAFKSNDKKKRFYGMINKYWKLLTQEQVELKACQDIRDLYNEIVLNEIAEKDRPDGKFFRKASTSVYNETGKELHRGIYGENEIIRHMEALLNFLNSSEIPDLIKISVFHYYFSYIHPFYDGNGRVNRFISSYLLSRFLDKSISFRISYVIKNSLSTYYSAFQWGNDAKNKGDLTPFVQMFLSVILEAEENTLSQIGEYADKLNYYFKLLKSIEEPYLTLIEKKILFLLIQVAVFQAESVNIKEISRYVKKSEASVRPALNALTEEKKLLSKHREHSVRYAVDLEALEQFQSAYAHQAE